LKRSVKNIGLLILLVVIVFLIFRNPFFLKPEVTELNMTEFVSKVKDGEINTSVPLEVMGEDKVIEGEMIGGNKFKVTFLDNYDVTQLLLVILEALYF